MAIISEKKGEFMEKLNLLSYVLSFFWGTLSFFSPCIIPLIPIYISYLAGGSEKNENGELIYNKKNILINTILFSFGICSAFFILGLSFTFIGDFFFENKDIFSKIGGIIIILLGLFQLGVIKNSFLEREKRINIVAKKMNPLIAFLTGFTFSFAWTPCVGPMLTSILIMASSIEEKAVGNLLIFIYSLGFTIPFILLGIFTTTILNFIKRKQNILKYTVKIGGFLLIIMGVLTFSGKMLDFTKYLGTDNGRNISLNLEQDENKNINKDELLDQYGNIQNLEMYHGKVVFLNFWASWCPPCKEEMPYIEELYKEYGKNKKDVIFLGVVNPSSEENPYGQDKSKETIIKFIRKNKYTFPTAFDETGEILDMFRITAFPTTFIIGKDGEIKQYVPGAISKDTMKLLIDSEK